MGSSVIVSDEGSLDGRADLPVEPDDSVKREQALHDAGPQPAGDAAAVALESELVLQRPDDRLDALAQPVRERPGLFVLAGRCSSICRAWSRSPYSFGLARPNPVTVPSQVHISISLDPQYQREWLGQ